MILENYSLLMEKFPKLALSLPHLGQSTKSAQVLSFCPCDLQELIYFYGIGVAEGYYLLKDWLASKATRRLIFLEDNLEELASFLHLSIAKELLENPRVFIAEVGDIEELVESFPTSKLEVFSLPSKEGPFFQELKEKILSKAFIAWSQQLDRVQGYQLFDQFLQNVPQLAHSFYANRLQGRFKGVPAIVCGAGPSLQEAVPLLKRVEKKALLIAGGSSLAALSAQGISPHFGMAIDPNQDELSRLKNSFSFEVPFLYATRLFPDCFRACNGPFVYMRSGIGGLLELWLEEALGLQDPLIGQDLGAEALSVSSICLAWAQFLGCNPIFLAGVDLAYTGKRRYAEGIETKRLPITSSAEIGVDRKMQKRGKRGEKVETALRWVMESTCFSQFAEKHAETSFFTLDRRGLAFERIPYFPMEKVEDVYLMQEEELRKEVLQEIFKHPMPAFTSSICQEKLEELAKSLDRSIAFLEILAKKKRGVSLLAELDLREELAYSLLFYDAEKVLEKERLLQGGEGEPWAHFLDYAQKYRLIFENWKNL